jgi:hypothetical protein
LDLPRFTLASPFISPAAAENDLGCPFACRSAGSWYTVSAKLAPVSP